ncbi:hypothetical protein H310_06732 [Aphanomyces invadans]|uniref:Secreted protein n=1 Tax=Aphanomyces invadans TaxID=157072 RepID=A0A024U4E0_9STRA|nr:hypothetical protein H310_06732 [Aphanomyces invadans]ETW01119.1 hypothetical protein H310_06732 [Aphanomyces invadans]|eukprot:XP_008870117.1 hypothetical protein H310_06732 [Aphanomyces invadans]
MARPTLVVWMAVGWMAIAEAKSKQHSKVDRMWRMQKKGCEMYECSHLNEWTNMNCVHECISAACYAEVYASEPLEDGEIDEYRYHKFLSCIRNDYRARARQLPKEEL